MVGEGEEVNQKEGQEEEIMRDKSLEKSKSPWRTVHQQISEKAHPSQLEEIQEDVRCSRVQATTEKNVKKN